MPPLDQQHRAAITELFARAGILPGHSVRTAHSLPVSTSRAAGDSSGSQLWTLTTEQPAMVWDWDQFDFVNEVLLMDGMILPEIKQLPLLDSHNRSSVDDQIGSVVAIQPSAEHGSSIEGLVRFSADDKGQRTAQKVMDGHITDGSVGYSVTRAVWVPEGTEAAISGRLFAGPLKVSMQWQLKEFSITPIGADTLAKVKHHCAGGRLA